MKIPVKWTTACCLFAIIAISVFFRFYNLDSLPPGLYQDVGINGTLALESLKSGNFQIYYPESNGREGLIIWLDALSMALFGVNTTALKIPAALIGTLTVLAIFFLCCQLFGKSIALHANNEIKSATNRNIALLAAFFCGTAFWHVSLSRIGFRAILVPFFLVLATAFLWKAFKEKKIWAAIAGGLLFGLGFYTYTVFSFAVLLFLAVFIIWYFDYLDNKKKFIKLMAAALLAIFFTALPMGVYFFHNQAQFLERQGQTAVWATPNPAYYFSESLVKHLGMFNFRGDPNWRHNYAYAPALFFPVGLFFLMGIWKCAKTVVFAWKKKVLDNNSRVCALLLLWLAIMLLPGILTFEGIPHALRTIGVIPPVMILSAIGAPAVYTRMRKIFPKPALFFLALIVIVAVPIQCYLFYFVNWANNPWLRYAFMTDFADIGQLTWSLHDQGWQTVVIVNMEGAPVPFPDGPAVAAHTVKFIEISKMCYGQNPFKNQSCRYYSSYIKLDQIRDVKINGKTAIVPLVDFDIIFEWLSQIYPKGKIAEKDGIRYYEINQ